MCDWLPQVFPYQIHHCHLSHYAHQNFNTLSIIIIPENLPIIPGYSENLPDNSRIFLDSFPHLLCLKLCRHNRLMPNANKTLIEEIMSYIVDVVASLLVPYHFIPAIMNNRI